MQNFGCPNGNGPLCHGPIRIQPGAARHKGSSSWPSWNQLFDVYLSEHAHIKYRLIQSDVYAYTMYIYIYIKSYVCMWCICMYHACTHNMSSHIQHYTIYVYIYMYIYIYIYMYIYIYIYYIYIYIYTCVCRSVKR